MCGTTQGNIWIEDICIVILCYMSVRDILRFGQTCRRNAQIASAKVLWVYLLEREIITRHIPFPAYSRPIAQLSGSQTKSLVTHVLRLHRSTTCDISRSATKVSLNQALPVTWVQLVNGTWLLAAMSNESLSTLMLFSIADITEEPNARPMAQCFLDGPVASGLVEICGDDTVIALDLRSQTPSIDVLTLQIRSDKMIFVRIARHPGLSHIRALRGPFIGFALHDKLNLSVPSILNWKTGKILHLQQMPDVNGSAMAMAIHENFIAVVTPRELHLFEAELHDLDSAVSHQVARVSFPNTISFAQVCFAEDGLSTLLRVCSSSDQGLRLYSAPLHQLLCDPVMGAPLWSLQTSVPPSQNKWNEYQLEPLFGKSLETVSWLESFYGNGNAEDLAPMRFATFAAGLAEDEHPNIPIIRLSGVDTPAMYAMCTRDYDDGLGLLALGNIFGELALYQLAGVDLGETRSCLQCPALSNYDGSDLLSLLPIASCPSPPFPLDGTLRKLTDDEMKALDEETRGQRPREVPREWSTDLLEYSDEFMSPMIGQFRGYEGDIAWQCEHIHHYLGHAIPLMQNYDAIIFLYGGLYLVFVRDLGKIFLIQPGLSMYEFADTFSWRSHTTPIKELFESDHDEFTHLARIRSYWSWEVRLHQKDRWKELKTRGGTVADIWSDVIMNRRLWM